MDQEKPVPGFAPDDITDGRAPLEWQTRYSNPVARRAIGFEAVYLALLLVAFLSLLVAFLAGLARNVIRLPEEQYQVLAKYAIGWLSGSLGGTLFDIKWLYHSVAKHLWNQDRRLWRLFTPHLSGALSVAILLLISSGILGVFDRKALGSLEAVAGLAFLTGYFSDSATAKLAEVAETLFGVTERHRSAERKSGS